MYNSEFGVSFMTQNSPGGATRRDRPRIARPVAALCAMAQKGSAFNTLAPISAGCMASAAVMYPADVVRALRMASASEATSLSTTQLLRNFVAAHGVLGLAKQGVLPEMARATMMRVVQFFTYPLIHEALFSKPLSEASPVPAPGHW